MIHLSRMSKILIKMLSSLQDQKYVLVSSYTHDKFFSYPGTFIAIMWLCNLAFVSESSHDF